MCDFDGMYEYNEVLKLHLTMKKLLDLEQPLEDPVPLVETYG